MIYGGPDGKKKKKNVSKRLEQDLRRDLYSVSPRCHYCKRDLLPEEATLDHVIPRSKGGRTTVWNCVIACGPCNNKKGDSIGV